MKRLLLVASLSLVAAACAGVPLPKESLTDPSALLFNGYVKANVACYKCHNGDGKGTGRGPSLARNLPRMSEAKVVHIIADGEHRMPAFKDRLTEAEIGQLATWLKTTFPAKE